MADIRKEIQDFQDAVYGEEVRGSMISLTEKVNRESTDAKAAAERSALSAEGAARDANTAIGKANTAAQNANTAAQNIQIKADRGDFTGTIQIGEVITGEPGSEAAANNSGTGKDAVIDLTIPRGYQGVSMRMAGAWAKGTEYVNDTSYIDLVTYQGSTYGCKRTHTASEETVPIHEGNEYWQCIAKKGETGDIENIDTVPIAFEEAEERENIESGDSIPKGFGKIRKWFSDLKQAAFMNVVNGVTQSEAGKAVLDAAVGKYLDEKKLDISRIVANRNITEPNFVMDGKTAVDWFTELNGNFTDLKNNIGYGALLYNSLLQKAAVLPVGFYVFNLAASGYTGNDLPQANYAYGHALVMKRSVDTGMVILTGINDIYTPLAINRWNGVSWSGWESYVRNSDLPQWRKFSDVFGTNWIEGMLYGLVKSDEYAKFEHSSAGSHEGFSIVYKLRNDYFCSGIFIPGSNFANSKRIFIINGIPNNLDSWMCREII